MTSSKSSMLRAKVRDTPDSISNVDLAHAIIQATQAGRAVFGILAGIVVAAVLGGWWLFDLRDDIDDHSEQPGHKETARVLDDATTRLQSLEHSQATMTKAQAGIAQAQKETVSELAKIRRDVDRNTERLRPRRR